MIIGIAPKTVDLRGALTLEVSPGSDFGELVRRASRVKTLDGGVSVNDFGFSDADREFRLVFRPTRAQDAALRHLVRYHDRVTVSTFEGVFVASPAYRPGSDSATLTLSVVEALTT